MRPIAASTTSALHSPDEQLRELRRAFAVQLDDIARLQAFEQLFDIAIPHPDAPVRSPVADRAGRVGAVNAEPLDTQTKPARAERIRRAGGNDFAGAVVGGIRNAIDDDERADRAGRR